MTAYKNFVIDLPERSMKVLNEFSPEATEIDLEVTLLIMSALAILIIPTERLAKTHPIGDADAFSTLAEPFASDLGKPFVGSSFDPSGAKNWKNREVEEADFVGDPDSWITTAILPMEKPASYVFSLIRNALSHGNLYTRGDPIEEIVFVSERRDKTCQRNLLGYKYLALPVNDFREFLKKWLEYIQK